MYNIICVTNRSLTNLELTQQLEIIFKKEVRPTAVILREKDLPEGEYRALAEKVLRLCSEYKVKCILHYFTETAIELKAEYIHLPLEIFKQMSREQRRCFKEIGVSTHSLEDALLAEKLGADYITAGHIFVTDCKKGVPPRGIEFLQGICKAVKIPVYAIGGINEGNIQQCMRAGAAGVCMMSEFMKAK